MADTDRLADLERRLARLEDASVRPPSRSDRTLEVIKALSPILAGALLAVVGYFLTGSVNNAINRERLELSQVAEMRGLILDLSEPGASRERLAASALALSAFGEHAVPPLLSVLQNGGDNAHLAARDGLRAAGLLDRLPVCERLGRVLDNRTRLYDVQTHLAAVELCGELDCREMLPLLERYHHDVQASLARDDLRPYAGWLSLRPAPRHAAVALVDSALVQAIDLLRRPTGRAATREGDRR